MSVATSFTVFAMLLLVVAGNDLEEQPSTSNGLRRSQPIPVPGAIRDRYFTTDSGSIVHLNMNEYEAQIQRMFRSGRWVTTRRGRLHFISAGIEEDESQPSTLGWTGDATPNINLPSDISEESLIAAADRAIAEASTFPDEATQRVVMEESNSSSDEAISFYRRLNQSTPPTVSPISSGSFHSGFSPDPASQESLISMEVAVGSPPLLSPSADRDPQWEAMRAVSRSLSIVTQVHHIGEGAIYESEPWMVRRPEEEEFRAAVWEEIRERWMVRRLEEEFRAAAPAAWEEIRSILADFLYETATHMEEDSRRRNTAAPSNGSTPATQPREVSCPVCFANLPTIAPRLCGHTLCRPCSNRVGDRCPTCRELIVGRFTIYLPRYFSLCRVLPLQNFFNWLQIQNLYSKFNFQGTGHYPCGCSETTSRPTSTQSSPHHTIRHDSEVTFRPFSQLRLGFPFSRQFFPLIHRRSHIEYAGNQESDVRFPCSRQFFPPPPPYWNSLRPSFLPHVVCTRVLRMGNSTGSAKQVNHQKISFPSPTTRGVPRSGARDQTKTRPENIPGWLQRTTLTDSLR
ncbi:hypothetical protein J6590_083303 [Homalodisca vitripennis]|nr:hypothetical protein J6590_083303 [Homalodisca vitripennis]